MLHKAWLLTMVVLLAGCTDQPDPEEVGGEVHSLDTENAVVTQDGFDAANFTKVKERVYEFQDLVAGAAPGSAQLEDHYGTFVPAREDTFSVGEGVWKLSFSSGMACGTGSGRIVVHGPDGEQVYASPAWNLVGVPVFVCVVAEEPVEDRGTKFAPGEYTVTYYVAGAMELTMEVDATYLVPNEADAA